MTTTHTAHRQRTAPRTTGRGRVQVQSTKTVPANDEKPVRVVKPMRTPDSDDHLATYFRHLAEHELLTPEDERELSQGIEDTEILTWERVLCRPEVCASLLALIEPNLETPIKFPKLQKAADDLLASKKARKDPKLVKKLTAAAKETAAKLRTLDLDRVHIDAVARSPTRRAPFASRSTCSRRSSSSRRFGSI